jgi:hypothetical protein
MFALWGGELALAWLQHANSREARARRAGVSFDPRTPAQVVLDLRGQGMDAVPAINRPWSASFAGPTPETVFPLGGVPNRLTILCNESGAYARYQSDAHGFNNPPELWDGGPVSVAILGDSFIQGSCVGPEESLAAGVRRAFPRTLNLGYGGNGPLGMLATLIEYAQPVRPAQVIWSFYEGNDLDDLEQELAYPYLRSLAALPTAGRQHLIDRQEQVARDYAPRVTTEAIERAMVAARPAARGGLSDEALRARFGERSPWVAAHQSMKLSALRQLFRTAAAGFTRPRVQVFAHEAVFRQVLAEARDTAASWGGRLSVLYMPEWQRYRPFGRPNNAHRDTVLRIAADLGIPVIDLDTAFRASGAPHRYFPLGLPGHYTAEGYQLAAREIVAALRDSQPGGNR